jgi:hypothetical protein
MQWTALVQALKTGRRRAKSAKVVAIVCQVGYLANMAWKEVGPRDHRPNRTPNQQTCANTSDQPHALTLTESHSLHHRFS